MGLFTNLLYIVYYIFLWGDNILFKNICIIFIIFDFYHKQGMGVVDVVDGVDGVDGVVSRVVSRVVSSSK